MNFTDTHVSLSHTVHNREMWGAFVRDVEGWWGRIVPHVWALVLPEHDNSPPIPHQPPGIGGRAYTPLIGGSIAESTEGFAWL